MVRSFQQYILVFTTAVAGSLLYFYFDPSFSKLFPPCPFFRLTGLACPGCGSQRAFHALLHGRLLTAMSYNILFVLFLPLVLYSALVAGYNLVSDKKVKQGLVNSTLFTRMVLVVVVLFWVARNIPGTPFNWLAP